MTLETPAGDSARGPELPAEVQRVIADSAPVMIWVADVQKRCTYFNAQWLAFTGRALRDEINSCGTENIHPDDVGRREATYQGSFERQQPFQMDYRLRRSDGAYRWVLETGVPLHGRDGTFLGYMGSCVDITPRHSAEERAAALNGELRLRAAEMQTLLDVIPIGIGISLDPACNEIRVNPAFAAQLHIDQGQNASMSRPDAEQLPFRVLQDGREIDAADLPMQRAAATGSVLRDLEYDVAYEDGTVMKLLEYAAPLLDDEGRVRGSVGAFVDITERKRTEEAQRLLARASELLTGADDYLDALEDLGELLVPAFTEWCLFDLLEEGRLRRVVTAHADPERRARALEIPRRYTQSIDDEGGVGAVVRRGRPVLYGSLDDAQLQAAAKDAAHLSMLRASGISSYLCVPMIARNTTIGALTFASSSQRPFDHRDLAFAENLGHRAAIAIDNARLMTELRETADRLRHANAAKDEFLGLVSHELRTPITTIYGNAQVLRRRAHQLAPDEIAAAVTDIEADSERLHRIIENLLVLARMDTGAEVATEPLLPARLLEAAVAAHERRFPHRKIELSVEVRLPPLLGDATYFEQVVGNLLSNAEKYSARDQPIAIDARRAEDRLRVSVSDRGEGLARDEVERVFTPFYRGAASRQAAGAGMGLAVCRRLVEAQGGAVGAATREGGGAVFWFELPLAEEGRR